VLKENMLANGESLDPSAHRVVSGYARFEFDAPDDAHGRQTVGEAQRALGDRLGTLQGALVASSRDGGRQLHADFGTTFGTGPEAAAHASRTLGELIGSAQNGIDQGFDARADRTVERQRQTQELFERVGGLAKVSAAVAAHTGQEEIAGGLEGIEKATDALKAAVPQATPSRSAQGALLGDLRDSFTRQLGNNRAELANPLKDGANDAATDMSAYEEARRQGKTIAEAQRSQDGALGSILMRTIVPSPDSVAQPNADSGGAKGDVHERLDRAILEHNREYPDRALPAAREIAAWDREERHGTVLALGEGEYAISTGRGAYRTFDASDVRNQSFRANEYVELGRDGTVHQHEANAQVLNR
jgi:hypothetical protein